ncbi:hypothetical protein [Spiroplasma endosymbiont of Labia minor]|uniref:hypothetical protein n=1 Tax=Spiroplasma endosymbiont of Labia minor TaxID=3066305 RepID=UPI0030D2CF98
MHELIINKNRHTKIIKNIQYKVDLITKIIKMNQFHLKESSIFYYPSYIEQKWRNLILMFSLNKISKEILLDNLNRDFKNNYYISMLINYYVKLKTEWIHDFTSDDLQKMKSDITYLITIYIQYYGHIIFGKELMKKI